MLRYIVQHDGPVVDEPPACSVEATPVFVRCIISAKNVVEFDGASRVPPKHLENRHRGVRQIGITSLSSPPCHELYIHRAEIATDLYTSSFLSTR